jgi:hypothetical protein
MSALETLAGIAKQQRARRHQLVRDPRTLERAAILKRPRQNYSDREERMLLLKAPVSRTASAHHIGNVPPVALAKDARRHPAGLAIRGSPRHGPLQFRRNFCQEFLFSAGL